MGTRLAGDRLVSAVVSSGAPDEDTALSMLITSGMFCLETPWRTWPSAVRAGWGRAVSIRVASLTWLAGSAGSRLPSPAMLRPGMATVAVPVAPDGVVEAAAEVLAGGTVAPTAPAM